MSSMMCGMLLGAGVSAKKTYVDDVFNTFLYTGNGGAHQITNGVDNTKGALVWFKNRSIPNSAYADHNTLIDTVRGGTKYVMSNRADAEETDTNGNLINTFNNNGFTLQGGGKTNTTNYAYAAWNFRKAPGFFDVVTWSGNGTAGRQISHSLSSIPGCIIVKSLSTNNWYVHHRGTHDTSPEDYVLSLDTTDSRIDAALFNDTLPTSTHFTLNGGEQVNGSGIDYVAYVFAGGESTAATARSVDFDGTNDYLYIGDSADWILGDTFTLEAWIKLDSIGSGDTLCAHSTTKGFLVYLDSTNERIRFYDYDMDMNVSSANGSLKVGQWTHVALVNNSGTAQWYIDGIASGSSVSNFDVDFDEASNFALGSRVGGSNYLEGKVSNFRIVKGTAVYTSSFRPPTEPLTNITNTKLLCCQNSAADGYTVSPGNISEDGSPGPAASTDSPFDDPAAFTFGENEDQNVIKCGSYVGNGSNTGPEINLGFEPQWVMIKCATYSGDGWLIFDSMRGVSTGGEDIRLFANTDDSEPTSGPQYQRDFLDFTSTGFKLKWLADMINRDGETYVFVAIRRPDGYVGKPADAGTGVFAMDTGAGSATIPGFDSNFPVDFALVRAPATGNSWETCARLIKGRNLMTDTDAAETTYGASDFTFDSNVGWLSDSGYNSTYQSWMWKRHAGFDVVTYDGNSVTGRPLQHSLSKIPEMMWVKSTNGVTEWMVFHKGADASNPSHKYLRLHTPDAMVDTDVPWNDTEPTATHFTVGSHAYVNQTTQSYIAMLFASVDGISKVGSYTGNGSATERTITLGFQPRFLILKNANGGNNWFVFDTVRGWASGNDTVLSLESDAAQYSGENYGAPTSNGFTLTSSLANVNENNSTYIYYAHA